MQGPTGKQSQKLTAYETLISWVCLALGFGEVWLFAWLFNPNIDSGLVWLLGFIFGSLTSTIAVTRLILLRLL